VSDFSPSGPRDAKAAMRRALLAARRAVPPAERRRADAAIAAGLARLAAGRVVAAYVPMPGEPGGEALLPALGSAARLLLPVLRPDADLDWAEYRGSLQAAGRGLYEPTGPRLGVAAVAEADLVIVPAVAVDRRGMRLGRGGGSYDRALARATGQVVAVLDTAALVAEVPVEPHDRPVRAVIMPDGLLLLPAGEITPRPQPVSLDGGGLHGAPLALEDSECQLDGG